MQARRVCVQAHRVCVQARRVCVQARRVCVQAHRMCRRVASVGCVARAAVYGCLDRGLEGGMQRESKWVEWADGCGQAVSSLGLARCASMGYIVEAGQA